MNNAALLIENLSVLIGKKEIISDLSLFLGKGKLQVLMGPNGSGKSSLASALMGHPKYRIEQGRILLGRRDITNALPEERAEKGLFLAFQHPVTLPGVSMFSLLQLALRARSSSAVPPGPLRREILSRFPVVGLQEPFLDRDLHVGFSGGEQRRAELVQLLTLQPKVAILDEIDSGLDVDGLTMVGEVLAALRKQGTAVLYITHSPRFARYVHPDGVSVLLNGKLVLSGGTEVLGKIEKEGFRAVKVRT